jgi:hypothetical protein
MSDWTFRRLIACCAPALLVACPERASDRSLISPAQSVAQPDKDLASPGAGRLDPDAYVYIAKKPLVSLALVESRGLRTQTLPSVINNLALQVDSCLRQRFLERSAQSPPLLAATEEGAVRIVLAISAEGSVVGVNVRTSNDMHSPTVLICLVAKAKATRFEVSQPLERPGLALEALWRVGE